MRLPEILKEVLAEADKAEGFTQDILGMVDLDIEYSPVIAISGEGISDAADVVRTIGGNYIVKHPLVQDVVTPGTLKRMRLRYLIKNKERWAKRLGHALK